MSWVGWSRSLKGKGPEHQKSEPSLPRIPASEPISISPGSLHLSPCEEEVFTAFSFFFLGLKPC